MIKIGILSFAHMHAYSYVACLAQLKDEVEIAGLWDENEQRGKKMAQQYSTTYYGTAEELLSKDITGVILCNENAKHKDLTILAAKYGKHVLCEKPIATTITDAEEMINICKKHNVKLQIAFPCRYASSARKLKELLQSGKLGHIVAMKTTNHGMMPGDWFIKKELSGGGALMDHIVHVVDLIRWITKKEIKKVYAEKDTLFYDFAIDDCGIVSMELEDGIFATLDPSWSRPIKSFPFWGDVTMKLIGMNGVVEMDMFNQKMILYNNERVQSEWLYWGDNLDLELIKSFITCIKNNTEPEITGKDGLEALRVVIAAYDSAEKHEPVYL